MPVPDMLERSALLYPDRTAFEVIGGHALTYRQLRLQVRRMATVLDGRGVSPGDRVVLVADSGTVHAMVYLAVSYLGASVVPVSGRLPEPELAYIVDDAVPSLIVADSQYLDAARAAPSASVLAADELSALTASATAIPDDRIWCDGGATALMIYTSGTTGSPKGVCLSQDALVTNAMSIALSQQLTTDDVFLSATPLHHTAAGTRVYTMLLDGGTHVVLPSFSVEALLDAIDSQKVTTTILVPTQLHRLVRELRARPRPLPSLRLLVYGAAPSNPRLIDELAEVFDCGLYQGYGLTEACVNLTGLLPVDHETASDHPHRLASVGRAVPGVALDVRLPDGAPAASDEVGELWVRSGKVMNGYWRRAEATEQALAGGWLHTGDLGRIDDDGFVYLVDRKSDLIIRGGVNIYPKEIEVALQRHAAVADAAVVSRPDEEWGELVVAFVTVEGAFDPDGLEAHCRSQLAPYKVPAEIRMVDEFERTASGKIRKGPLRVAATVPVEGQTKRVMTT